MSGRHASIGFTELLLSEVALDQGDIEQAGLHLAENATLFRPLFEEHDLYAAFPLHLWAEIAVRQRRYAIAVALSGAQSALFNTSPMAQVPTQREAENTLNKARASLDREI